MPTHAYVVGIMKQCHILYEHTPYSTYLSDKIEAAAFERECNGYDNDSSYSYSIAELKEEAESQALRWLQTQKINLRQSTGVKTTTTYCKCGEPDLDIDHC